MHRRVYDILNILESIGLLERTLHHLTKEGFRWKSVPLEKIELPPEEAVAEPTAFEGLLRRPQKKKRVAARRKREQEMAAVLGALSSAAFGAPEGEAEAEKTEEGSRGESVTSAMGDS